MELKVKAVSFCRYWSLVHTISELDEGSPIKSNELHYLQEMKQRSLPNSLLITMITRPCRPLCVLLWVEGLLWAVWQSEHCWAVQHGMLRHKVDHGWRRFLPAMADSNTWKVLALAVVDCRCKSHSHRKGKVSSEGCRWLEGWEPFHHMHPQAARGNFLLHCIDCMVEDILLWRQKSIPAIWLLLWHQSQIIFVVCQLLLDHRLELCPSEVAVQFLHSSTHGIWYR